MTDAIAHTLLRWLPADSRVGVLRRMLIVWAVAFFIAVFQTFASPYDHPLSQSLVYSYAISTSIWFFTDPVRIVLRRWLKAPPPHYWRLSPRSVLMLLVGIVLGYAIGTSVGDAYSGRSTWELLTLSPQRFWGFGLSSLAISLGFLFYFSQREKALELQRQATEARLKLLETQLEPHMLFNTLANLRVLIKLDPDRATAMLDRLGDYLRATLKASRTDAVDGGHTLADECARLRDYLELMAVRMGPRLAYTLDLPAPLQQHLVPPLLLQPLVENAIRHGLEPQVAGGTVTVTVRPHNANGLQIDVHDSGVGMHAPTPGQSPGSGGFGLAQVRERLATAFPGRSGVELQSAPGQGTRVRLWLPALPPVSASATAPRQEIA